MTGGGLNSQVSRYTHNDSAFSEYNSRLQSSNLQTFTTAASKFTEWLGSDRAYYPNARVPVRLPFCPLLCPRAFLIVELLPDCLYYRGTLVIWPFSLP